MFAMIRRQLPGNGEPAMIVVAPISFEGCTGLLRYVFLEPRVYAPKRDFKGLDEATMILWLSD